VVFLFGAMMFSLARLTVAKLDLVGNNEMQSENEKFAGDLKPG